MNKRVKFANRKYLGRTCKTTMAVVENNWNMNRYQMTFHFQMFPWNGLTFIKSFESAEWQKKHTSHNKKDIYTTIGIYIWHIEVCVLVQNDDIRATGEKRYCYFLQKHFLITQPMMRRASKERTTIRPITQPLIAGAWEFDRLVFKLLCKQEQSTNPE